MKFAQMGIMEFGEYSCVSYFGRISYHRCISNNLSKIIYFSHFRHVHTFTEQLMQTKLPILTYEECTAHFGTPLPEQQFCTLDTSRRRSPCLGDEGGPLVYDNRLLGILLFRGRPTWVYPDIFINFNNLNIHDMVNFHMNALRRIH